MAVVFSRQRPIGKIKPHRSGAVAAFDGKRRCLGLFTSEGLAIMALMDCAKRPIEVDVWRGWVIALLAEESVPSETPTYKISACLPG